MGNNILLYGATGYTGSLIAAEGERCGMSASSPSAAGDRMILAARDGVALRNLAQKHGMDFRVFGLDDNRAVLRGLNGVNVVINAAGPFAFTAEALATAAVQAGCHYVDVNGELDVYMKLDDLAPKARHRKVAIVSSAGHTGAASNILLREALSKLSLPAGVSPVKLGAVRIAISQPGDFSRGSAATVARSLREQVLVVRRGFREDSLGQRKPALVRWHEPVGRLERAFDFGEPEPAPNSRARRWGGIAVAANLVDTLIAQIAIEEHRISVQSIESYARMGAAARVGYFLSGALSSLSALPGVGALTQSQLPGLLSDDPDPAGRNDGKPVVLLEIDDLYQSRVIDWRLTTPNVYQFTAQLAVAAASRIARSDLTGWVTPANALAIGGEAGTRALSLELEQGQGALRGCQFERRTG